MAKTYRKEPRKVRNEDLMNNILANKGGPMRNRRDRKAKEKNKLSWKKDLLDA